MSDQSWRLDPMNKSMYLEDQYPLNYEQVHNYVNSYPNPVSGITPNAPKLAPQPTKDSMYYSNDGRNDGHISTFEKLKAFAKGGTYNLVRSMFCDENGFSWKRTLLTAGAAAAIGFTGVAGLAVAGTLGLISAADNFIHSADLAKNAKTDQDARDAYEGIGESTATAGLSLWAGWKGIKGLTAKWFKPKANVPPTGEPTPPPSGGPTPPPSGGPTPPPADVPTFTYNNQLALPSPADVRARMIADGQFNLPAVVDKPPKLNLPPIETFLEKGESQFNLPTPKTPLGLPSPADVRARMIADGQFNLPVVDPKTPKLNLPPVGELMSDGKLNIKLPPQAAEVVETPVAEAAAPKKTVRTRKAAPKKTTKAKSKKTTTRKPKTVKNKASEVLQARSYTDKIYDINTTPNPDVEYFYYAKPTNTHPDAGFNEPNHFFG